MRLDQTLTAAKQMERLLSIRHQRRRSYLKFVYQNLPATARQFLSCPEVSRRASLREFAFRLSPTASFLMRINEMTLSGAKIPSFRAVLTMPSEPRRLPDGPKSVSARLLSLFTRTSSQKVWVQKMADFRGFMGWPHLNVFGHIPVGNTFGESEVYVLARNRAGDCPLLTAPCSA